jgi:hypothetical protein
VRSTGQEADSEEIRNPLLISNHVNSNLWLLGFWVLPILFSDSEVLPVGLKRVPTPPQWTESTEMWAKTI